MEVAQQVFLGSATDCVSCYGLYLDNVRQRNSCLCWCNVRLSFLKPSLNNFNKNSDLHRTDPNFGIKSFTSQRTCGWVHGSSESCWVMWCTWREAKNSKSTKHSRIFFGSCQSVCFCWLSSVFIRFYKSKTTNRKWSFTHFTALSLELAGACQLHGSFLLVKMARAESSDGKKTKLLKSL